MTLKKEIPHDELALFGTSSSNGVSVDDYTKAELKLQEEIALRFTPKKVQSEKLAGIYSELSFYDSPNKKIKYNSRANSVSECGSFLEFHQKGEQFRLAKANFCKDRLCPMCAWRRSLKIYGQVSAVMDELQQRGDYAFLFLTLTVRNCDGDELEETIDALHNGFRVLTRTKEYKRAVLGSFRTLEITRNLKDDTYHPHLHCVLVVDAYYFTSRDYLKKSEWQDLWKVACGLDYDPIIDIKKITETEGNISKAVAEVSKYAVKGSDLLHGSYAEMCKTVRTVAESLFRRRLCSFTGIMKDIKAELNLDDPEDGDLIKTDIGEDLREDLTTCIVRYGWRGGYYERM